MQIGEYECKTPFVTAGSGNARWCVAEKYKKQFFLKEFLAPVQPVQTTITPTRQVSLRRQKCAAFETRKLKLYDALKQLPEDRVVRVHDFFVHDGHYYAASAYLGAGYQTLDTFRSAQTKTKLNLLISLSDCLRALHGDGIVHADLKPEHIVVEHDKDTLRVRLIDFDSGFLETAPPETGNELEVDPVYMSPEAYQKMTGKSVKLDRKLDTFALGILIHQTLAGGLPGFDRNKYSYLYAAVLDRAKLSLSQELSASMLMMIQKMLKKRPAFRPDDDTVSQKLKDMLL